MEKFLKKLEQLLTYLNEIQKGKIAYAGLAERLAKEIGMGTDLVRKSTKNGVKINLSNYLEKIKEGEDIEVFIQIVQELVKEHNLDETNIGKELDEAIKEAERRKFGQYVNLIENANIHLISKAREMEKKLGIKSYALEEAIMQGEYAYLIDYIREIEKGAPFYFEEETLRNLAKKYNLEKELEEAINKRKGMKGWRESQE